MSELLHVPLVSRCVWVSGLSGHLVSVGALGAQILQSERMQGFAADPVYAKGEVFAYVGLPQNLKEL